MMSISSFFSFSDLNFSEPLFAMTPRFWSSSSSDDYDGLVFAAMPQLDNYKDCARRMQLDSIAPEASIMDIDLVDPYNTLFFSICY